VRSNAQTSAPVPTPASASTSWTAEISNSSGARPGEMGAKVMAPLVATPAKTPSPKISATAGVTGTPAKLTGTPGKGTPSATAIAEQTQIPTPTLRPAYPPAK